MSVTIFFFFRFFQRKRIVRIGNWFFQASLDISFFLRSFMFHARCSHTLSVISAVQEIVAWQRFASRSNLSLSWLRFSSRTRSFNVYTGDMRSGNASLKRTSWIERVLVSWSLYRLLCEKLERIWMINVTHRLLRKICNFSKFRYTLQARLSKGNFS